MSAAQTQNCAERLCDSTSGGGRRCAPGLGAHHAEVSGRRWTSGVVALQAEGDRSVSPHEARAEVSHVAVAVAERAVPVGDNESGEDVEERGTGGGSNEGGEQRGRSAAERRSQGRRCVVLTDKVPGGYLEDGDSSAEPSPMGRSSANGRLEGTEDGV
jgi:hypothetical protein